MNYSYSLRIFWCCLWGIIFEGSKFQFRKNSVVPTCVRSLYKKKIIVACPTDKGDPGRLTIIANKCSIVRNAPCRMNMHPLRRPDPCPFFFPDLSSTATARPSPPSHTCHTTPIRLEVHVRGEGPRLPEQPQSLHRVGSSTGPLPGLWYGSGGRGADAEGR
jgi:hypothetical protein